MQIWITPKCVSNLVHIFHLQNNHLDEDDPWSGIPAATDFTVHSTYHTKLQDMPGQLVLRRNMVLNTPSIAYWEDIGICKQGLI